MIAWLIDWPLRLCWMACWLYWSSHWLIDWTPEWNLTVLLVVLWMNGWLVGWRVNWLVDWFTGGLTWCTTWFVGWLVDQLLFLSARFTFSFGRFDLDRVGSFDFLLLTDWTLLFTCQFHYIPLTSWLIFHYFNCDKGDKLKRHAWGCARSWYRRSPPPPCYFFVGCKLQVRLLLVRAVFGVLCSLFFTLWLVRSFFVCLYVFRFVSYYSFLFRLVHFIFIFCFWTPGRPVCSRCSHRSCVDLYNVLKNVSRYVLPLPVLPR